MKQTGIIFFLTIFYFNSMAGANDSTIYFPLPDSVKAISFMADISVNSVPAKKESSIGIQTSLVKLFLESDKKEKTIEFEFPKNSLVMAKGLGTRSEKGEIDWVYNWNENEDYRLLITSASDSAGNYVLYSGYIFLPREKKWKLIGTCKIEGQWGTLKHPAIFSTGDKKTKPQIQLKESWCQRNNGSWKNLLESKIANPVVNLLSHVDSLAQATFDERLIKSSDLFGKIEVATNFHDGIYYSIINEGSGRQVTINDTVTVFYKGYLFSNNSIFDETKERPATFPLNRLIKGWQIGLPLCRIGGKIKIVIPSGLAYSIRTRSAKIPPNSILVFEVEVVEAKSP